MEVKANQKTRGNPIANIRITHNFCGKQILTNARYKANPSDINISRLDIPFKNVKV